MGTPTASGNYSPALAVTDHAGLTVTRSVGVTISPVKLTGLGVSPRKFKLTGRKVNGRCAKPTAQNNTHPHCKRAIKLHIAYTLNAPVTVIFKLKRVLPGRKVNGHCVKPGAKNNNHKHCTRKKAVPGSITASGKTSANSFTFTGKIGGHKLGPGTYQLTATTGGAGQTTTFTITR